MLIGVVILFLKSRTLNLEMNFGEPLGLEVVRYKHLVMTSPTYQHLKYEHKLAKDLVNCYYSGTNH